MAEAAIKEEEQLEKASNKKLEDKNNQQVYKENMKLQDLLNEANEKAKNLQNRLDETLAEIQRLKQEKAEAEESMTVSQSSTQASQQIFQEFEYLKSQHNKDIETLNSLHNKQLDDIRSENSTLIEEIQSLREIIDSQKKTIQESGGLTFNQTKELNNTISRLEDTLQTVKTERDEAKNNFEKEKKERIQDQKRVQTLMEEITRFEYDKMLLEDQVAELSDCARKLREFEELTNLKESEWERFVRMVGSAETDVGWMTRYMLSNTKHKMVPGYMMFHQLYYWRPWDLNNSPMMRAIVTALFDYVEQNDDNYEYLAYGLGCSGFLLYMMQKVTKGDMEAMIEVEPFEKVGSSLRQNSSQKSPINLKGGIHGLSDFMDLMNTIVGKAYGSTLKAVTKKIDSAMERCILMESFTTRVTSSKDKSFSMTPSESAAMSELLGLFTAVVNVFQQHMIHFTLAQRFFSDLFSYIDASITNGVLLRQQFCTDAFGRMMVSRLEYLERWVEESGDVWASNASDKLIHAKQVATVLTLRDKAVLVEEKQRNKVCPHITVHQLRQLFAMFTPDEYGKRVPINVITAIAAPKISISGIGSGNSSDFKILLDKQPTRMFPISLLHYLEVVDTFQTTLSSSLKTKIEEEIMNHRIATTPNKRNSINLAEMQNSSKKKSIMLPLNNNVNDIKP